MSPIKALQGLRELLVFGCVHKAVNRCVRFGPVFPQLAPGRFLEQMYRLDVLRGVFRVLMSP